MHNCHTAIANTGIYVPFSVLHVCVAATVTNLLRACHWMWLCMSAAPWWAILIVLSHTLHLTLGSPTTATMNGHVFVHSSLKQVLYLVAPKYFDLFSLTFHRFAQLVAALSGSVSQSVPSDSVPAVSGGLESALPLQCHVWSTQNQRAVRNQSNMAHY